MPPKNFRCICQGICKIKLPYNKHRLNHNGEKLHHCRVCDRKFNYKANSQTHLTDKKVRTFTCSLCDETIVGQKNYYIHYMDAHTKKSIRKPQTNQSSASNSDEDKAEEEERLKYAVQEEIESSRQDTLNMFQKRKQQPTDYNTEEYKKLLKTLISEKNSTGQFNEAKCMGPLFWKNSLFKAGLIEEAIHPVQFQGRLKPIECTSCGKFFARLPKSNEVNMLPSKLPCSKCFNMKNDSGLLQHQFEKHRELPPFICKECLWESETWYKYIQHMKKHIKYEAKCSECVYSDMMNKPANIIFLCHVCEMSFGSDDELRVHAEIHLEN
ncbi:zinc finger protein 354A-like [Acyrthosiphon pisum]|uniref:C2H2-type domain-containing protein n=1 Tax=Acyrthosiphon pisum TaxID=7029 RepID=A0A8R2F8I8_ACYPI|nr:zinc finger protein 354A-like [Acyrthosiphon pisum]|eukprot:XP_008183414.1 PREDICTED: zinc finger protein 354A-like [Acyrthosiphon pisum]